MSLPYMLSSLSLLRVPRALRRSLKHRKVRSQACGKTTIGDGLGFACKCPGNHIVVVRVEKNCQALQQQLGFRCRLSQVTLFVGDIRVDAGGVLWALVCRTLRNGCYAS